MFSKGDPGGK